MAIAGAPRRFVAPRAVEKVCAPLRVLAAAAARPLVD
jgi:hypothetical protein